MKLPFAIASGKLGKPRFNPGEQPTQVFRLTNPSKIDFPQVLAIYTKTTMTVAGYISPSESEYVGTGAVLELYGKETYIEQGRYYRVIATYYDGNMKIVRGWISYDSVQQMIVGRQLRKIRLTDQCAAECVARQNKPNL